MIMDLNRFIADERPFWQELERMLEKLEAAPAPALDPGEIKRFHYLYQRASADLARLRTFSSEREIRRFLESLVARAYAEVHESRKSGRRLMLLAWFFKTFPRTFRRRRAAFWLCAGVMTLGAIFGGGAAAFDPEAKAVLMPFPHLQTSPSERVAEEEARKGPLSLEGKASFSSYLMTHNTRVSIFAMALGMTWGLGTVLLLFYNGAILGAVAADYILSGETAFLAGWLLPHGAVEIPSILVAGQAGLVLAGALIGREQQNAPLRTRLRSVSKDLTTLIFGVAVLLIWAGLVEAFFSQHHEPAMPYEVKIGFGVLELVLLAAFFWKSGAKSAPARAGLPAAAVIALCLWTAAPCAATETPPEKVLDFTDLSLEELKNVEIVTASKTPERLSEIPAAVYVITQEDIRRSGANSIPEILRLAPGVQAARVTSTEWDVNIRGLNELYSNKLLVLIDGRSVYTPIFSGVFWDMQDVVIEDIERIEVIRGPGAAVWGANAVNGVINIITKSAAETDGTLLAATGGTEEGVGTVRYGDRVNAGLTYRLYLKYFSRGELAGEWNRLNDIQPSSNWDSWRAGWRMDWRRDAGETFTFQGDAFTSRYDTEVERIILTEPYISEESDTSESSGGHLLGRWERRLSGASDMSLQLFYDRAYKEYNPGTSTVDTLDLDGVYHYAGFSRHDIVCGLGFRHISDRFGNSYEIAIHPERLDQQILSAFIQDEVRLLPDRLSMTLGAKFEHNDYTGFEVQPSVRFLLSADDSQTFWTAVSRAVRVPSRLERDVEGNLLIPGNGSDGPVTVNEFGNPDLKAETLVAYELGYRVQPADNFWLDAAIFFNDYDDLITLKPGEECLLSDGEDDCGVPLYYDNVMEGEAWGIELAADWAPVRKLRFKAAYTFLETKLNYNPSAADDLEYISFGAEPPRNQFSLRAMADVTPAVEFDLWFRYVDRLADNDVDDYNTLDARLAWRATDHVTLSVTGQNLFDSRHSEYSEYEVKRSVYGKIEWAF